MLHAQLPVALRTHDFVDVGELLLALVLLAARYFKLLLEFELLIPFLVKFTRAAFRVSLPLLVKIGSSMRIDPALTNWADYDVLVLHVVFNVAVVVFLRSVVLAEGLVTCVALERKKVLLAAEIKVAEVADF